MAQLIHGTTIAGHEAIHLGNMPTHGIATTSYVTTQINNLINGAPGALDTLNELAAALGNNANFASAVTDSLAGKLSLTGGTMTGTITITSTDIRSNASSGWTGDPGAQGKIQYHANRWYIVADQSSDRIVQFRRNSTDVSHIDNSGVYHGNITGSAGSVAWTNVSSRPTALSQFTNDLGNYGGFLTTLPSHNHDDRYYTEAEINSQIGDRLYQARVFGLNVNAFHGTGLYRGSTGDWSNRPSSIHNGGALLTIDTHPGDYHSQLFFDTGGDRLYFRNANAGAWGSWNTMIHSGNISSYALTSFTETIGTGNTSGVAGAKYQINDTWLRVNSDNRQFQIYGNARSVIYRTDGITNDHGGGAYPHIFYYGSSADSSRIVIFETNGDIWMRWAGDWLSTLLGAKSNVGHTHDDRYYTETEVNNFFSGATAISGYNKSNWDTAFNKRPTAISFSGGSTKTLTLTQGDGSTLTASFNDIDTDTNTDGQTLSISGSTLTISGGNSVTIPSGGISQGTADSLYVNVSGDTMTGALTINSPSQGAEAFAVNGINGRLFTVVDDLTDSLYSVNTLAGLPVLEVFANNIVQIGKFGTNAIYVGQDGRVGFGTTDFSYTVSDVSGVTGTPNNNRVFVNGSIQLLSDSDGFVVGRGGASFFKDEEIAFGWGGGWFMQDATYLRVRGNKMVYSGGSARFDDSLFLGGQTYRFYSANSGLWTNGNLGADGDIYLGTRGTWLSSWLNQALLTSSGPSFANVYVGDWFRNNSNNTGLYNQTNANHFYSRGAAKWGITGNGGNIHLEFRSNHESTLRGVVYADTGNQIGFLNNGEGWAFRTNSSNNAFVHGNELTINSDGAGSSNIIMVDGDEGNRIIHCNSNRIGFLNQAGSWGAWCDDAGNWSTGNDMYATYFYGSGSIRVGDMWGGAGLYRPSGSMVFGIENSDWIFSKGAVTQAYFAGGDGNLWMRWAGDWLSNLLGAKSNTGHTHDDRYYTESESDGRYLAIGGKAADAELVDGIDSSRIVFGDGARASTNSGSLDDPNQKSGFYFAYNPTGRPYEEYWNWITIAGNSWQSSNNYSFQLAHDFHSDRFYVRRMTNGGAAGWREVITSGNIGSQSVNAAATATNVAWTGVTGRPTALSQFNNDLGNYGSWITSSGSISGNSGTTSQRDFSGDISTGGMGRFTGWYSGNAATTLATEVGVSGGQGYVIVYNRQTGSYGTLNFDATNINLAPQGGIASVSGSQIVTSNGGNWNIAVPRLYASGNKEHYLGESSGWDGVGFGSLTNLHFQGHPQFWIGAGNAYWWGGAIATEHDLLITTMPGYSSTAYYRGITFAVDNSANGNNGGSRLGRWQTYGTGWDTARLQVDASLSVGYGNRLQGSAYNEAKYPLDRGVWAHGRDNDGYGGDRIRSKLFSPTANGGGPWGSFASLEVSSVLDGNSDIPALFRMHQWGSGSVEFWKPQGRTLFVRESPGGGGTWFDTLNVQARLDANSIFDAGSRVAISRGEGRQYVDYSRYVYNNGAYSGVGWIEPSDLGVRYAASSNTSNVAYNLQAPDATMVRFNSVSNTDYSTMTFMSRAWADVQGANGLAYTFNTHTNSGGGGYGALQIYYGQSGYVFAPTSFRAPIFYDSGDTGYYLDPNDTSNLWRFTEGTLNRHSLNSRQVNSPWSTRASQGVLYQTGAMGWGQVDLNVIGSNWGSGFFDTWSSPANGPGSSGHYVGMQAFHYSNSDSSRFHGWQMACAQEANNRWFWRSAWDSPRAWVEMIHSGNIGSQTVSRSDGALKLWAESHPTDYYVRANWTGSYWQLTSNHPSGVQVAYANDSGYSSSSGTASRATRANGNFYIDDNYGNTVVGVYESTRLQGVWAMGDAYKLAADGTNAGNLYGLAWSHPNAGGQAGFLSDHGLIHMMYGTAFATISSNIWCRGDIIAFSDLRVKTNIEVIQNAVDKVMAIRGVTFNRTDFDDKGKRYAGVIAQEVLEVLPEVVTQNEDNGHYSVSYGNISALLIEAIKEQQQQILELKEEIKKLKGE